MYKFELDNVLNYRVHVEETIKSEFSGIEKIIEKENRRYAENNEDLGKLASDINQKLEKGISIKECGLYFSCIADKHQSLSNQRKIIDQLTGALTQKRDELISAVQNRKIMEKLREHRNKDAAYRENIKEIEILDEYSSQQRRRRQTEIE